MSKYGVAIVWIDRHEAKIFQLSADAAVKTVIANSTAQRIHHRSDHEDANRHAVDDQFLCAIIAALAASAITLITGPGNSKFELKEYLDRHHEDLPARIASTESSAEDADILGLAREYFATRTHRHWVDSESTSNQQ